MVTDSDLYERLSHVEEVLLQARHTLSCNDVPANPEDGRNYDPRDLVWIIDELARKIKAAHEGIKSVMHTVGRQRSLPSHHEARSPLSAMQLTDDDHVQILKMLEGLKHLLHRLPNAEGKGW